MTVKQDLFVWVNHAFKLIKLFKRCIFFFQCLQSITCPLSSSIIHIKFWPNYTLLLDCFIQLFNNYFSIHIVVFLFLLEFFHKFLGLISSRCCVWVYRWSRFVSWFSRGLFRIYLGVRSLFTSSSRLFLRRLRFLLFYENFVEILRQERNFLIWDKYVII